MDTAPAPQSLPPKKSGKKWIFIGCGGCLVLVVIAVVAMGGAAWFGLSQIKGALVVVEATQKVQNFPEVQAALGTPIEPLTPTQAEFNTSNGTSTAKVTMGLKGPKGTGTMKIDASKPAGQDKWQYALLQVDLPDGKVIDLRTAP